MKLIVGLGNPGIKYQFTLHNLGFLALDRLAVRHGVQIANRHCRALTGRAVIGGHEVLLAKPETYMNLSGLAVRELIEEYGAALAQDLLVLFDDLDLPFGQIRVRPHGSAGSHNGMRSIVGALDSGEFARVRLGIHPGHPLNSGADYVLSAIRRSQLPAVDKMLEEAANAVEVILKEGMAVAMNRFNRKAELE